MTSLKDTSDSDSEHQEPPADAHRTGASLSKDESQPHYTNADADLDEAWKVFASEHSDDFDKISRSHSAKQFDRHARREHTGSSLPNGADAQNSFGNTNQSHGGPRDINGQSWLDTDDIMDSYDTFTPPNPEIGHVRKSKLVFWLLFIVGVLGLIATVLFPQFATLLSTIFGLCALMGATGLIVRHRGFTQTREDYLDDGARV